MLILIGIIVYLIIVVSILKLCKASSKDNYLDE